MASKRATDLTKRLNATTGGREFDPADLARVTRGFIAARAEDQIVDDKGRKVIDTAAYDFLRDGRALLQRRFHDAPNAHAPTNRLGRGSRWSSS